MASPTLPSSKSSSSEKAKEVDSEKPLRKRFLAIFWLISMAGLVAMGGYFWYTSTHKDVRFNAADFLIGRVKDIPVHVEINTPKDQPVVAGNLSPRVEETPKFEINLSTDDLSKIKILENSFVQLQGEMAALGARLNALEQKIALNPYEPPTSSRQARSDPESLKLSTLADRISALEKRIPGRQMKSQGVNLMIALSKLQKEVLTGQSYSEALQMFKANIYAGKEFYDPVLKILEPFSEKGIETPTDLYLEFPDLADSILHILSPEPNTIWGKIKSELSSLYSIRVVDPEKAVEGSVEYILLAIEECLQIKDVTKALSYLARLGPQIDTIAESWVQKAENYLQIELAVHQLEAYAFWQSLGHSLEGVTPLSHNTVIPQESGSAR